MHEVFTFFMEVFRIANKSQVLINDQIKFPEVMVIGPNGEQMGLKKIEDALTLSSYAGLDLVLMTDKPRPVCKIIDYNKYRYEKQKKEKEAKKRQRESNLELKEYRLSVVIDKNDMETKLKNARRYAEKGHKIKATIRFKGRQMTHPELGKEVLLKFAEGLNDVSDIEQNPKMDGRNMSLILAPKKK